MATTTSEPEFIPIIEEVLSNSQAAIMLVCGAVAGAFVLWAFIEYQKSLAKQRVGLAIADRLAPEPVEYEAVSEQRGDNRFNAFQQQ